MFYTNAQCKKFVEELEDQYEVKHYRGRYFWEGPAVRAEDANEFVDIIRMTTVPIQWDSLGQHGYIVYPKSSDKGSDT